MCRAAARILAACRVYRRVIDRSRIERDFVPHQKTIENVNRNTRSLLVGKWDRLFFRLNRKKAFQLSGIIARERWLRSSD